MGNLYGKAYGQTQVTGTRGAAYSGDNRGEGPWVNCRKGSVEKQGIARDGSGWCVQIRVIPVVSAVVAKTTGITLLLDLPLEVGVLLASGVQHAVGGAAA